MNEPPPPRRPLESADCLRVRPGGGAEKAPALGAWGTAAAVLGSAAGPFLFYKLYLSPVPGAVRDGSAPRPGLLSPRASSGAAPSRTPVRPRTSPKISPAVRERSHALELLAQDHADLALLPLLQVERRASMRVAVVTEGEDVAHLPADPDAGLVVGMDPLPELVQRERCAVAESHAERALLQGDARHALPRVEPHAVVRDAAEEDVAVDVRAVLEGVRDELGPQVALGVLLERVRDPLGGEAAVGGLRLGLVRGLDAEGHLPVVVDGLVLPPALARVGLAVGEAADVADALVLELLAELGAEEVLCDGDVLREVGVSLALGRLHAAEREVLHAELVVGHLVVVVEPGVVRRAHLVDVAQDPLPRVRATLVLHLLLHEGARVVLHVRDVGEPCVSEQHDPVLRVGVPHARRQLRAGLGSGPVRGAVDGEGARGHRVLADAEVWDHRGRTTLGGGGDSVRGCPQRGGHPGGAPGGGRPAQAPGAEGPGSEHLRRRGVTARG
mmetsp:Transcript_33265/g.72604  ORF Transcript_33265/g.72604 Transcript_33265/m.72604 type:complete len:500 (+) Transcript_33265:442-1941(+)